MNWQEITDPQGRAYFKRRLEGRGDCDVFQGKNGWTFTGAIGEEWPSPEAAKAAADMELNDAVSRPVA